MVRQVNALSETGLEREELIRMAEEALKPENLVVVARGEENRKDHVMDCIEKYGLYFYIAGHIKDSAYYVYNKGVQSDALFTALRNMAASARIGNLFDLISGGAENFDINLDSMVRIDEFSPNDEPMYILTNEEKMQGAGLMLCDEVLNEVRKKIGNFWIAPSSIHELVIIPQKFCPFEKEEIVNMVTDINGSVVDRDERLSNNAFFFDGRIHE